MKKGLLPLLFLILGTLNGYSFENYKQGWILTNDGETIKGWIDFKDWVRNPSFIAFKKEITDRMEKYGPNQIKQFSVGGDIYESFSVTINTASRRVSKLKYDPNPQMEKKTAFLKLLFRGKWNLYKLTLGNDQVHFLFGKRGEIPEELLYHMYLADIYGSFKKATPIESGLIRKHEGYKGQLVFAMRDCPGIKENQIEKLSYVEKDFVTLFKNYEELCGSYKDTFEIKRDEGNWFVGITLGGGLTSFIGQNSVSKWDVIGESDVTYGFVPQAGVVFEFMIPGRHNSWSLYNEIGFSQLKAESDYSKDIYTGKQNVVKGDYSISYVGISTALRRYLTPQKNYKYYIELGGFLRYGFDHDIEVKEKKYDEYDFTPIDCFDDIRKMELGGTLGFGCKYKRFGVGINYIFGNGFSNYSYLSIYSTGTVLKASYFF